MGATDAFISKRLKNNEISKIRRELSQNEIMNFLVWAIQSKLISLNTTKFTINIDDKPKYEIKLITEQENNNE